MCTGGKTKKHDGKCESWDEGCETQDGKSRRRSLLTDDDDICCCPPQGGGPALSMALRVSPRQADDMGCWECCGNPGPLLAALEDH